MVLLRGIGSCEDLPLRCVDSCLDAGERLRRWDGGRDDDGTEDSFTIGCNGTGADGLSSTGGPGGGSEETVAALPQQFPMGGYERLISD